MSINNEVDNLEAVIAEAAFQAKAVEACEFHPYVTIYHNDSDADRHAYALATNSWKAGRTIFDREEVTEALADFFGSAAEGECPQCAHLADD